MKRSGSTLLSSAKPNDQGGSEGLGVRVGIDAGLAARCRQECMPSEGTTHAASSSTYLEPANLLLLGCWPTCCILSLAACHRVARSNRRRIYSRRQALKSLVALTLRHA